MKGWQKVAALILSAFFLLFLLPLGQAFADGEATEKTVTIESEKNGQFDYLEYYSDGSWHDLNTPKHWITSTGQVCYCIEHKKSNPHGSTYTAAAPSSVFGAETLAGLQTILMYGYPCNTPEGFTEDEARQATANAIRFWLSENGEEGSYGFTNRKKHPGYIRAKKGYEHVLSWADELLQMARDKKTLSHSISFTPSALTLTKSQEVFTGSTQVKLVNINSGYTLDTSSLPDGVTISGYTGTKSETLSFTAPMSLAGQTFTVTAAGKDTRSLENITAYIPSGNSLQKIFLCATVAQVVSRAGIGINTPALGSLLIAKTGESGAPIEGVRFGIYADADCQNEALTVTTEEDGTVLVDEMAAGTWYVKELSTVAPYVLDGLTYSVSIAAEETAVLELENGTARGIIRIEKTGEVLTGTDITGSVYGQVHTPVFKIGGIEGCVFTVKDAEGNLIETITTDADGIAETGLLPLGTYTVKETQAAAGYQRDDTVHTVTLSYLDQNTPIVKETVSVANERIETSVAVKKMTDFFNTEVMEFEPEPLEGAVFGLYTGEDFSLIPKNTLIEILTTDEYGKAVTESKLPMGRYYLRELAVPDGTIRMSTQTYPLTVSGRNEDYYDNPIHNERFKGRIAVWKEDESEPGRMLGGAVYTVTGTDGLIYWEMTTDENGYAVSVDLPAGTYSIKETVPPRGFIVSDEVIEIVLTTDDKNVIEIARTNAPNRVVLKKTDLTSGKPVPDAVITITNETGDTVFEGETDQNGEIILAELPAGTYTYCETSAPAGYALNPETFTFTVDDHGNVTGTAEITDEPITLILQKTDLFTGQPFMGVRFRLIDGDGQTVRTVLSEDGNYRIWARDGEDTFLTDENGRVEFRYLPVGEYRLIEDAPSGYIAEEEILFSLTDSDGLSGPKTLNVENCPTGVRIGKIDAESKNPIQGAGFLVKVRGEDGFTALTFSPLDNGGWFCDPEGTVTCLMTGVDGQILLYGLPLGDVWMEEYVVPEGYFPISAQKLTVTKEMTSLEPYAMTIENSRFVKLGLDTDWWEIPAMAAGCLLLLGGAVTGLVLIIRKKKQKEAKRCR